jgi:hypothetical protein
VIPVNPVVPNAPTDTDGNIYILNNQTMTQLVEGHAVVGGMGKQTNYQPSSTPDTYKPSSTPNT